MADEITYEQLYRNRLQHVTGNAVVISWMDCVMARVYYAIGCKPVPSRDCHSWLRNYKLHDDKKFRDGDIHKTKQAFSIVK